MMEEHDIEPEENLPAPVDDPDENLDWDNDTLGSMSDFADEGDVVEISDDDSEIDEEEEDN